MRGFVWDVGCGNRDLVKQFRVAADAEKLPVQQGILMTTRHIVSDPASKAELRGKSGACAVDMETAGIAEAADETGLPWVAVRAIVDRARTLCQRYVLHAA